MLQNDVDVELMAMLCCCLMFPRLETIYREKLWQHFRTNDQDRRYNFKHKTNGPYTKCFLSVLLFRDGVRSFCLIECKNLMRTYQIDTRHNIKPQPRCWQHGAIKTAQNTAEDIARPQPAAGRSCWLRVHFVGKSFSQVVKTPPLLRSSALLREEKGAILITDDCADPNLWGGSLR